MDTVCEGCPALLDDNYGCTHRHQCETCVLTIMIVTQTTLLTLDRDWIDESPRLGCRRWLPKDV